MTEQIHFYSVSDEFGCLSNFAPTAIIIEGQTWPTSEHFFQAQKFQNTDYQERIRQNKSPMIAARMGRSRKQPLRSDWESVKVEVMRTALQAKFTRHADLREILLSTGNAVIVEHTRRDADWGDGGDGSGKKMLGRLLMEVREAIRSTSEAGSQ